MAIITINTNATNLVFKQQLIGSTIVLSDGEFEIVDFEYDSRTHTFTLEYSDGNSQEISDKLIYPFKVDGGKKIKATKKRGKK